MVEKEPIVDEELRNRLQPATLPLSELMRLRRPIPREVPAGAPVPGGSGIGRARREKMAASGLLKQRLNEKRSRQRHSAKVKAKSIIKHSHGKPSPRPNRHKGTRAEVR